MDTILVSPAPSFSWLDELSISTNLKGDGNISGGIRYILPKFNEEDIQVDVFWLDTEHSREHKYLI